MMANIPDEEIIEETVKGGGFYWDFDLGKPVFEIQVRYPHIHHSHVSDPESIGKVIITGNPGVNHFAIIGRILGEFPNITNMEIKITSMDRASICDIVPVGLKHLKIGYHFRENELTNLMEKLSGSLISLEFNGSTFDPQNRLVIGDRLQSLEFKTFQGFQGFRPDFANDILGSKIKNLYLCPNTGIIPVIHSLENLLLLTVLLGQQDEVPILLSQLLQRPSLVRLFVRTDDINPIIEILPRTNIMIFQAYHSSNDIAVNEELLINSMGNLINLALFCKIDGCLLLESLKTNKRLRRLSLEFGNPSVKGWTASNELKSAITSLLETNTTLDTLTVRNSGPVNVSILMGLIFNRTLEKLVLESKLSKQEINLFTTLLDNNPKLGIMNDSLAFYYKHNTEESRAARLISKKKEKLIKKAIH